MGALGSCDCCSVVGVGWSSAAAVACPVLSGWCVCSCDAVRPGVVASAGCQGRSALLSRSQKRARSRSKLAALSIVGMVLVLEGGVAPAR